MKELYVPHLPMFSKTACGWSARILHADGNEIVGLVLVQLSKNKTHTIPMYWDKYGMPTDLQSKPSNYYLRLK